MPAVAGASRTAAINGSGSPRMVVKSTRTSCVPVRFESRSRASVDRRDRPWRRPNAPSSRGNRRSRACLQVALPCLIVRQGRRLNRRSSAGFTAREALDSTQSQVVRGGKPAAVVRTFPRRCGPSTMNELFRTRDSGRNTFGSSTFARSRVSGPGHLRKWRRRSAASPKKRMRRPTGPCTPGSDRCRGGSGGCCVGSIRIITCGNSVYNVSLGAVCRRDAGGVFLAPEILDVMNADTYAVARHTTTPHHPRRMLTRVVLTVLAALVRARRNPGPRRRHRGRRPGPGRRHRRNGCRHDRSRAARRDGGGPEHGGRRSDRGDRDRRRRRVHHLRTRAGDLRRDVHAARLPRGRARGRGGRRRGHGCAWRSSWRCSSKSRWSLSAAAHGRAR